MRSDGKLILCTVVMSAPEYGLAILDTFGGTGVIKEQILGLLPYSDATCGALLQIHIQDGSTVVCMRYEEQPRIAYILTPVNHVSADMTDGLDGRLFYAVNNWTTWNENIFNTVLDDLKKFLGNSFKNHANSVDKDVLPGDIDIVNNGGPAGLHIGKYLAQLKGSPLAFIDVASIEDRIRMVASQVETHTMCTYNHISDSVSVSDAAADAAEAFGMPAGTDLEEEWDPDTVPLFRLQEAKGAAADGKEEIVVSFPQKAKKDGEETSLVDDESHTGTTVPPVLAKDRTAFSGERMIASAKGISSVKSPALKAVLQFGYNYVDKGQDLLTPYKRKLDEPAETAKAENLNQEIMDAAINKVVDKLLTKDYLPVLMQRMMEAGLIVSEAPLSDNFTEHTTFGPSTEPAYPLPKFLTLKDPITGQEHLYFDSTSFISQEPDGSILLKDGYGSEIRMSQGNIYISPALDLQLRPGRDMWGLISRHMCLDSQGYAVVNSNKSVYLRAVGDMQLAAAADENGHGKLTIECDDKTGSQNSGLILRSLGNAAFTGRNMYVGINKGDSTTKERIENDGFAGTLIIDAGYYGVLLEKSRRHQVDTQLYTAVSESGQFATAFTISGNAIGLYAQEVIAPVSLRMANLDGTQKISVLRNGEVNQVTLTVSSSPNILMNDTTINKGQIVTNDMIISMKTVAARRGYFVSMQQIQETQDTFVPVDIKNTSLSTIVANTTGAETAQKLSKTIYQDYYIAGNCFRFPENYNVAPVLTIPGMAWQEDTRIAVGDVSLVSWEEKPVKDPDGKTVTACYPGWAVWQQGFVTGAGYTKNPLKNGYVTNTKKETKNA